HRRSAAAHRDAAHHEDPQFAARQSAGAICPPYSHRRRGFARSPGFPNPQRRRAQSAPAAPSPGPSSDGSPAPPTRPALPPSERLQPPAFPSIMSPNEQDYDPTNFSIRTLDQCPIKFDHPQSSSPGLSRGSTWIAGTSQDTPGHDEKGGVST